MRKIEQVFVSNRAGIGVADFLADELPLSKAKIKDAMQKGAVWLKRQDQEPLRVRRAKEGIKLHDEIHIYYDESFLALKPPKLHCLQDGDEYSIWSKPVGFMDEVTLYGDFLNLERALARDVPHKKDCYWVDPIKSSITGLILIAHSKQAADKMDFQLQQQKIKKNYSLVVRGSVTFPTDSLKIDEDHNIACSVVSHNAYNDTSELLLESAQDYEDDIGQALIKVGVTLIDESCELNCCKMTFTCPVKHKEITFTL